MTISRETLSVTELQQVDAICETYEATLRRGEQPPAIHRLVESLPAKLRWVASLELIRIDLDHASADERIPKWEDYRRDFPEFAAELDGDAWKSLVVSPTIAAPTPRTPQSDGDYPQDLASDEGAASRPAGIQAGEITNLSLPDYVLLETLGRGGMGTVFRARQTSLDRPCAVKMISNLHLASEQELQRFSQEARLAAQLHHPGIVQIYDFGQTEGTPYFSMELIEGCGLDERIREQTLPSKQAAELLRKIAEAVGYAHEQGVLHRDLKPSNVLLGTDGQPKISDFGLARSLIGDATMTAQGEVLGTPSYMPPEQASGNFQHVDIRSDVYSLGTVLYETLTGRPPFRAATPLATLQQVRDEEVIAPCSSIRQSIETWIRSA